MNTQELEDVLGKLKEVNEELDRVQNSVIEALDREVSLIEMLKERFQQRDEIVLEKVIYRVKATRSIDL